MNTIEITKLEKEPIVRFSNKSVVLPEKIQKKIDVYWQSLLENGKSYTRGEVFTVTQKKEINGVPHVLVEKTDYAHYLYCQNIDADLDGWGIRVIFTACLVETKDNKLIFGKMGSHTARSGIFQLAGGGIDNSDLLGDCFDMKKNISKELREELDINVNDKERVETFCPAYLKQGGMTNKIAVVYCIQLVETVEEFFEKYKTFEDELGKKYQLPEFGEVIAIKKDRDDIVKFFMENGNVCDEYMEPLLKYICK